MNENVGFITPDNKTYIMKYNEVRHFCKKLCLSNEYVGMYNQFKVDYTYFEPYFDFVMNKLNYIFINPLLEDKTYIKWIRNAFYKVYKDEIEDEVNYDSISSLALRVKNGGTYPHLVACSDSELKIELVDINNIRTCMIDPNGYTMMSNDNHEITSNTIVNQLLINSHSLYKKYNPLSYSTSFLIETIGFIRATSLKYDGLMIGLEKFLSPIQKEYRDLCVEKGCNFINFENETNEIIPLGQKEDYKIRG